MGSYISIDNPFKYGVVYLAIMYMVVYNILCYTESKNGGNNMDNERVRTSEAQKRAKQRYMESFVEVKVRMTPERRAAVQSHAQTMGESTTTFINRAITEAMERDSSEK